MEYITDSGYLLTIIVPLYNEEGNLPRLAQELSGYLSMTSHKIRVLFVNDGSTDNSGRILEKLCAEHSDFSFIHLKCNGGLSTALKAGFDQVQTIFTGYIDADLQTSPFDFEHLFEHAKNYELVTGIRKDRKDGLIKRFSSKLANTIRNAVTHDGASDTGCPLKIFQTAALRRIPFFKGMHRFFPALVLLDGGHVKEVPVRHFQRLAGKSNYQLHNRLFGPLADLIAFAWMRKRYIYYQISGRG
jgi:glycosyltransferase involved in cell wall biosynthesis